MVPYRIEQSAVQIARLAVVKRACGCLMLFVCAGLARAGTPALPNIPAYTTNVAQAPYNARADGSTTNTTAIQSAINDVSAKGGGTVEIPGPGVYLTGPLTMKSKINLQIDAGATLRMLPKTSWSGTSPLLKLSSLHDVEISGGGGIDGQGADWWADNAGSGLYMIYFTSCNTVLVQNVTVSNAPKQQIVFKSSNGGNITIQGVTIRAPSSHAATPSHNTDGIDLVGTNCLIQDCNISTGDDNIALGSSSSGVPAADILVANCTFGDGHGMTIGSNTAGGVSNLTVINCTFSGTDCGIRMKSDNATNGGGGEGGLAQNLYYYNLGMTNVRYQPILIYSYYNVDSSPTGITPATAAGEPVGTNSIPAWRNIVISNLWATVANGGDAGMIWGRTETPVTNVTLLRLNISASGSFKLYNLKDVRIADSQIKVTGGDNTVSLYNAQFTLTNSSPATNVFSMDGLAGANSLALYNARGAMSDSTLVGINPLTLSASTLSNSTGLVLPAATSVNFVLSTNNAAVAVAGNLALNSTLNITNSGALSPGTFTLFTYTGSLSGSPILGARPAGYNYSLDTNTAKQVSLKVMPTNATSTLWSAGMSSDSRFGFNVTGASGCHYAVQASTNLSDWTSLLTNPAPFTFTDTNTPIFRNRFYRAVYLP
jgi:polygalacturonase